MTYAKDRRGSLFAYLAFALLTAVAIQRLGAPGSLWIVLGILWGRQAERLWVRLPGQLIVIDGNSAQTIPLDQAEVQRGWITRFKWREGKFRRSVSVVGLPPTIRDTLVGDLSEPAPSRAAGATISLREDEGVKIGLFAVLTVTSLILLLLYDFHWGAFLVLAVSSTLVLWRTPPRAVTDGETLWIFPVKGEPQAIPVEQVVLGVMVSFRTEHPDFPVLHVKDIAFRDFVHILRGERTRAQLEAAVAGAEEGAATRCSLCGRTTPEDSVFSGVYICEACSTRTRVQAHEAGHGLSGKDSKPM